MRLKCVWGAFEMHLKCVLGAFEVRLRCVWGVFEVRLIVFHYYSKRFSRGTQRLLRDYQKIIVARRALCAAQQRRDRLASYMTFVIRGGLVWWWWCSVAEETLIFWKSLPTGIRSGGNSIGVSMQPCNTIIKPSITVRQSTLPFFLPFPLPFSLPFVLPFSLPKNKYII